VEASEEGGMTAPYMVWMLKHADTHDVHICSSNWHPVTFMTRFKEPIARGGIVELIMSCEDSARSLSGMLQSVFYPRKLPCPGFWFTPDTFGSVLALLAYGEGRLGISETVQSPTAWEFGLRVPDVDLPLTTDWREYHDAVARSYFTMTHQAADVDRFKMP
jgi:hypothetical protein